MNFESVLEVSEEELHETVEDALDAAVVEFGVGEEVEVSDHPAGDDGLAAAWRAHCAEHHHVFEVPQCQLFSVVPPFVVQELSQNFNRRLSPVFFLFRHVQVVHENYHLLLQRRPIDSSSTFVCF